MTAKTTKEIRGRGAPEDEQASQYARSLIEASLDPLVTINADGKITDVNEATVKVTGSVGHAGHLADPKQRRSS